MDAGGYDVPEGLLYSKDHEWARTEGRVVRVGITDYAAKTLNDVVYVTLPKAGEEARQFKTIGTVESIKAVSEIYSPASGKVLRTNQQLEVHPELVNKSPYGDGWLVDIDAASFSEERGKLLDAKSYAALLSRISSSSEKPL